MKTFDKGKPYSHFFFPVIFFVFVWGFFPPFLNAQEDIRALRDELRKTREESDRRIKALEQKLETMEAQSAKKEKELEEKVASQTSSWVDRYLRTQTGDSRFVLGGYGFGNYVFRGKHGDQNERTNSFRAGFNPVFLYRLNDWIYFEAEPEFELSTTTEVGLEYAKANVFLNDYMTLGVGKYLLPFGEFVERLHPAWINKLVTQPLPFREETDEGGLLPFGQVGAQLRGAVPLDSPGRSVEYTLFVGNGPRFASKERGAILEGNQKDNNSPKAYGARVGFRPLPFDWGLGRLKFGASTYNGVWRRGRWLDVWGLDTVYQREPFELRAEYLGFHREMFSGVSTDNRNGWYLQGAYKLSSVPIRFIDRSEVILRFSGVNSPQNPDPGDHPFIKRPRQVTLGWDYWLTPSVVWKLEYDRDLPRGAGAEGKAGNQFLTQFAVGF